MRAIKIQSEFKVLFTSDEHYYHKNILKYQNRSFKNIEEHNQELISRHNKLSDNKTITFHLGDFSLGTIKQTLEIINQLNGRHVFIRGSHDHWIEKFSRIPEHKLFYPKVHEILVIEYRDYIFVLSHYPQLVWDRSHYGSIHLFGHLHGELKGVEKSMDVGVDTNNFYPYTFEDVIENN